MIHRRTFAIAAIVALLCVPVLLGQEWPLPASADGLCNSACPNPSAKIAGFGDVFSRYTGRYVDSVYMVDLQQPFRTARAKRIRFSLDRKRIYASIGEAVGVFDANTFFTRLEAGEKMVPVTIVPLARDLWRLMPRPGPPEEFLRYDQYFYAENGSPWTTPYVDGQWRLWDMDADDQGYVYLAYSVFGWGIVKDSGLADGSMMSTAVQQLDDDGNVVAVTALKTSNGYYALTRQNHSKIWKLTPNRTIAGSPMVLPFMSDSAVKTSDMSRVALLVGGQVRIYNPDDLVQGRGPLQTFGSSLAPYYGYLATDGTKFYAAAGTTSGLVLAVFSPNGSGGYGQQEFQTQVMFSPLSLQATDSYMVLAGNGGYPFGPYDLAIFKMVAGQPQHIDTKSFFLRYYVAPPPGYAAPPSYINMIDGAVYHSASGKNYLMVSVLGLGDVYELKDPGSVSLDPPAAIGTPNSSRSADVTAGPGPFYSDLLRFTARSAAPAISWDFGDGTNMPNTTPATAGTFIQDHRYGYNLSYSGPAGGLGDPLPKLTTTTASSSTSTATVGFTLQRPVPRFGVSGYKYLFKQPDASSTAPIVYGDTFFDASDGDIDGHYALWSLDGVATKQMPSTAMSTGSTCGRHVLDFEAHYGANAQQLVVSPDYTTAIRGFTYGVTPFAASIDYAAGTTGVTFTAFPKATTNTSILSDAQKSQLTYAWSLVNAQGAPVPTSPPGPSGTGIGSIPPWTIDKSYFAVGGNRVQLVLTSPTAPGGSCAPFTSYTAATPPLNPPDPRVDSSQSCPPGAGPTCVLQVLSLRANFDQAADHWKYLWTVNTTDVSSLSSTTQTFVPTFKKVGTYSVSVTVSNDFATAPPIVQTVVINNAPPPCAQIIDGVNLFVNYNGPGPCGLGFTPCSSGQDITFQVQQSPFGNYDLNCATHTAHWDFGDGLSGDGMSVTHRYAGNGSYQVVARVSNGAQMNVPLTAPVTIGTVYPPPPPPVTGCPTIQPDVNMLISYNGPNSGCVRNGKACSTSEAVAFEVDLWQYSLGCGSHVFLWSFNDGSGAQPFGQYVTHQFLTAGTFTATVSVSVNGGAPTLITAPVVVSSDSGGGPPPTACPAMNPADPFVTYSGPVSHCATGTPCQTNETIEFDINTFQYPIACGTHEFTWDFNDGGAKPVGKSVTHVFTKSGTFKGTISVKIDGTAIATTIPVNVTIEGGARRRGSRH